MQGIDGQEWSTDHALFTALEGGAAIVDWFGFVPSFHDATLEQLILANRTAVLTIRAFRMTDALDERGYFILDKHAVITISLDGVSGLSLTGELPSIIFGLGIRRVGDDPPRFDNGSGPSEGDFEITIESSFGLAGSLFARELAVAHTPA